MRFTSLLYLDPSLTSLAFEEIKRIAPVTKISRSEDVAGSLGAGIFRLTGSTKETKEFQISTTQMFFEIEAELRHLPKLSQEKALEAKDLFWVNGILGLGSRERKRNNTTISEVFHFTIGNEEGKLDTYLDLVTHDAYFTSGYDRMAAYKDTLGLHIWEPVEALIRPIYSNKLLDQYLFAPFAILRL